MADREVTAAAPLYQCKSCEGHFPAGAFYASNLSRCKECVKANVRANRAENLDYYRSYDRKRYREEPHRKEAARESAVSEAGIASRKRYAERVKGQPERQARVKIGNLVKAGKLTPATGCFFCGKDGKLHAHHYDYSKPLDVFWLCPPCHGKLHTINGDFHRAKPGGAA